MTDAVKSVALSVAQEFEDFRRMELEKKSDAVFNNHAQIHFYCRVADYFENGDFQFYEKIAVEELAEDNGKILQKLWDYYSDCEEAEDIESYYGIYGLIRSYNGFCHDQKREAGEME